MCAQCGMPTADGEYHPYAFCVLYEAGADPWTEIRIIAGQLGLGDPGKRPPRVSQLVATPLRGG